MKKIYLRLFTLLFFSIVVEEAKAQSFILQYCSNLPSSTLSNAYGPMYSVATANATSRTAVIYPAASLSALTGILTNAYFHRGTATGSMAGTPNFKIYLMEVPAIDWGAGGLTWSTAIAGATLVYDDNPAPIVGSSAGWKNFPLTTNFTYSGTQNLAVLMEYTNATASTAITWSYDYGLTAGCVNTANSNTTKYANVTTGLLPATLASTEYRRPYIGFDVFVPPCSGPTPGNATASTTTPCSGLTIALNLAGNNIGTGQTYQWESSPTTAGPWTVVSGVQTTPLFNIIPPAGTTTYYRAQVTCGATTLPSVHIAITVPTPHPGGTFTINSALPGGSGNFQTFTDAVTAIACGITGPVVFNVDPASGPYNEQIILPDIGGTSSVNTVTFNGNGTTINFASANANERAVIKLNGTDYITIDSLVINATGGTYGFGIQLLNNADNNTISRCTITSDLSSTSTTNYAGIVVNSTAAAIITLGATLCDNNIITGNTITGGYAGIALVGNGTTSIISNNQVTNNTVKDFYLTGIHLNGGSNTIISGNDISRPTRTALGNFQGIFLTGVSTNTKIDRNKLHNPFDAALTGTQAFFPIYLTSCNGTAGNENIISNNLVYNAFGGSGNHNGALNNASSYARYVYNTFALEDAAATCATCGTRGIYVQGTAATNLTFMNNIVSISRGGTGYMQGIFFEPTTVSQYLLNGNVYHISPASTGSYKEVARIAGSATVPATGTGFVTIQNWQTGSAQEANSKDDDPIFVGSGSYIPTNLAIDNIGIPVAGITTDITAALRNASTSDPGAYEFNNPLSIKLLNFGAVQVNSDVRISWQVSDETGLRTYEVERSDNGQDFATAARLEASNGTKGTKKYETTDLNAMAGKEELYYRLKVISDDGSSHYSNMVKLSQHKTMTANVKVYPNPFSSELFVGTDMLQETRGTILVADIFGKIIINQPMTFGAGTMISQVKGISQLPHGIYTVIVEVNGGKYISKLTK